MCGIAGFFAVAKAWPADADGLLAAMRDAVAHRGPDDSGAWLDAQAGVALGHRRLSIVDLSPAGHQPMTSACGRFVVAFNGEIYNHRALREELGPQPWRGHSDTETLLACIARHGLEQALSRLVGMFAIALWDRAERALTLVRDRLGEKPLYWCRFDDGTVAFASELHALRRHPRWRGEIDPDSVAQLLRLGVVPAPHTIHRDVFKLEPASWLRLGADGGLQRGTYWSLSEAAQRGAASPLALSDAEATDRLEHLLKQSLADQMVADVPLGAFLSGGVDSSTVVALMARLSGRPVQTFCIGFDGGATSEAAHARAVARHIGTDHHELVATGAEALEVVPRLATIYDEPFADSSQIPTYLVARLARRHVTVALSGDAGDEVFAGYNRYLIAARLWRVVHAVPRPLRKAVAAAVLRVPPSAWDRAGRLVQRHRPGGQRHADVGDKLHKFARNVLPAADLRAMHEALTSHWPDSPRVVRGAKTLSAAQATQVPEALWREPVLGMCLADQLAYLPDDILVKVDRAAMAVGLETRVPMLDHRVVEWAWALPLHQRIRGGQTKWLLRQVLHRHVPRALVDRPKQGFAVPLRAWLQGPLRDWAEDQLSLSRLNVEGVFDSSAVRLAWTGLLSGRAQNQHMLWSVLMFQSWLAQVARPEGTAASGRAARATQAGAAAAK